MANYRGHIAGGVVSGLVVAAAHYYTSGQGIKDTILLDTDWQLVIGLVSVSTLFALWPDVDTNSKAQNLFYRGAFALDAILIFNGFFLAAALLGLLGMTPIVGKHRGWTHSKIAVVLVPAPILIFPYLADSRIGLTGILFYCAAVIGYFSHLLLDGLIWKRIKVRGGWR
jgi:membrane-bound metal-dependent hydrolase YbcI (DUF457 family)